MKIYSNQHFIEIKIMSTNIEKLFHWNTLKIFCGGFEKQYLEIMIDKYWLYMVLKVNNS